MQGQGQWAHARAKGEGQAQIKSPTGAQTRGDYAKTRKSSGVWDNAKRPNWKHRARDAIIARANLILQNKKGRGRPKAQAGKAEAVVTPAKAIEQKAVDKPMAKKIAKEITRKPKTNAERRLRGRRRLVAFNKRKLDMSMEKQWARQFFACGWEGRTRRDSFETCFETVWRMSTQGYF